MRYNVRRFFNRLFINQNSCEYSYIKSNNLLFQIELRFFLEHQFNYTLYALVEILWLLFYWVLLVGKIIDPALRKYLGVKFNVVFFWYTKPMDRKIKGHVRTGAGYYRLDYIRFTKMSRWEELKITIITPFIIILEFLVPIFLVLMPGLFLKKIYPAEYELLTFIYSSILTGVSILSFVLPSRKHFFKWGSLFLFLEPPPYDRFEEES